MKQAVVFILAFLYLGLTSGLSVNIHYCMGKISEVKFESVSENACGNCGKEKMNCCGHIYQLVKVNDEHQAVDNTELKAPITTIESFSDLHVMLLKTKTPISSAAYSPVPLYFPPDINVLNCVFRI